MASPPLVHVDPATGLIISDSRYPEPERDVYDEELGESPAVGFERMEFYDNFSRPNTRTGSIGESTSGHAYDLRMGSLLPSTKGYISDGRFKGNAGDVLYPIVELDNPVRRMGGRVRWTTGNGGASAGTFLFLTSNAGGASFVGDSLHVVFTRTAWQIQVLVLPGPVATDLVVGTHSLDVDTSYEFEIEIDGPWIYYNFNGVKGQVFDQRILRYNGPFLAHEIFYATASVANIVEVEAVWADSHTATYGRTQHVPGPLVIGGSSNLGDVVLFSDSFDGTTVNTVTYTDDGNVTQNGKITVVGDVAAWRGLSMKQGIRRSGYFSVAFDVTIDATDGGGLHVGVGLANTPTFTGLGNMTHGFYLTAAGVIKIYDNETDRGAIAQTWTEDVTIRLRIDVYSNGAYYWLSTDSGVTWAFLYDGTVNGATDTPLYFDFNALRGTPSLDNLVISQGVDPYSRNQVLGDASAKKLAFAQEIVHSSAKVQTKSANYTMTAADSGYITYVDTDAVVITLPATVAGMTFTLRNSGANGAVGFSISPAAADKVMGAGLTAADDKDVTNTKATARKGDEIRIGGDGVDGWYVQNMTGTWAREA